MIKKIAFVTVLFLFSGLVTCAQQSRETKEAAPVVGLPNSSLKFSFLSLADPSYQSVQFGIEYRLKDNVYLQHEAGYIFGIGDLSWYEDEFESDGGIRFRSELKSYFNLNRTDMKFKYYFAPEILFIFVSAKNLDFKGVNCVNGNCDYYRLNREEDKKYVLGTHFKIGGQRFFNWLGFEYYAGLGFRYKWYDSGTVPDGLFGDSASDNNIRPSLVLGVKLAWAL